MAGTVGQTRKEIIIDFSILNQEAVKTIQDTTTKIENLKRQQKLLADQGQKNTETYIKNAAAIRDYTAVIKANEKEIDNNIKAQRAEGDSLNAMRATLRSLTAQYADLSKAERESAEGAELLKKIDDQRIAVENLEHQIGDYSRQVGNYKIATEEMGGAMGKAIGVFKSLSNGTFSLATAFKNGITAVKGFSMQLLKLLANPIVAIIAAIAAVVMKLVDAFKKNDDAMTALQTAFAGFQPIINAVNKAFEFLVGSITKVIGGIGKLIGKLGGDAVKAEQEQVKRVDELEEAERQYTVEHAKNEAKISELRDKAADEEQYTAEERKKFLDEAIAIEEKDAKEAKRLAKERYETRKKELQNQRDTSDEAKNELAKLEAAMHQADKEYADTHRKLIKEQQKFQKEIDDKAEEEQKEREQRTKEWAQKQKEQQAQLLAETRKTEDLAIGLLTEGYAKQRKLVELTYDRQIEDMKKRAATEKHIQKQLNEQIILLQAEKQNKLGELDEKFNANNLKSLLEIEKRRAAVQIASMADGYAKQKQQLENQQKEQRDAIEAQIKVLTQLWEKYNAEGDQDSAEKVKQQLDQLSQLANETAKFQQQQSGQLKKSFDDQIAQLSGLNQLQQQLYNIEVDEFGKKEIRKTELLKEEAEKRLEAAKTEQSRLSEQLKNNPADVDLQLQYEQATQRVIEAQNAVKVATDNAIKASNDEKVAMIANFTTIAGGLNNVLGAFNSMFEAMAESNEKYQKFATAMAISQIYVSMAASIAQAVQAAVQAGMGTGVAAPATIPIFIAELIAIVASTIGSTISTLNKAKAAQSGTPKFAEGGLVGNQTTTRTDDSVNAKLSLGEYVVNSKSVKKYGVDFFDRINYGNGTIQHGGFRAYAEGGYVGSTDIDAMRLAFASVVEDMPNPVVSVKEIVNVENRIKVKEQL